MQALVTPSRRQVFYLLKQMPLVASQQPEMALLARRLKYLSHGAPTRVLVHLLRYKGRLNRRQIMHYLPKELFPSKTKLTSILRILVAQKRVKAFLPTGWIDGKDTRAFKLNNARQKLNFPECFRTTKQGRNLRWALGHKPARLVEMPTYPKDNPTQPDIRAPPAEVIQQTQDLVFKAAGLPQLQQAFHEAVEILTKNGVALVPEYAAKQVATAAKL